MNPSGHDSPAVRALLKAITSWDALQAPLIPWTDARFNQLALPLFARQYAHNEALRGLCDRRGIDPELMTSWREIPAIPTDAFKHMRMSVATPSTTQRTFLTSGTTQGARGAHHFGSLDVYAATLLKSFVRYMMSDVPATRFTMRFIVLAPDESSLPESSLSFMLSALIKRLGSPGSAHFIHGVDGELKFDLEGVTRALDEAERDSEPVMILSTAFALMQLFDARADRTWRLPRGSRLMETGGFKGRSREVSRAELYTLFHERLGIPSTHCVSEYSMTELSSQAYTHNLYRAAQGQPETPTPLYETPPWVKIQVVDPLTLKPLNEPGVVGLVQWVDLANVESALVVQTSDRGRLDAQGRLELLGRAPDSELRGCSLTIEELLDAQQDKDT